MKKRKHYKINELKWALFYNKKEFFNDMKILRRRKKFLKKHGYSPAVYIDTAAWFRCVMSEILTWYRNKRSGTPIIINDFDRNNEDDSFERNDKAFNDLVDHMLDLLDKMNEDSKYYEDLYNDDKITYEEIEKQVEKAKNEFFKLFSKYFFQLWQ